MNNADNNTETMYHMNGDKAGVCVRNADGSWDVFNLSDHYVGTVTTLIQAWPLLGM